MNSCPRCLTQMQPRTLGTVVILECTACDGVFLDGAALETIVRDPSQSDAIAALPRHPHSILPGERKLYINCPTCATIMNRKQFATGSGIVIDVCRDHGTFFDGGELAAIVVYVVGGGLERSAKKDALQARQDRLRERANAMYDRLCAARAPKLLPPHRARDVAIAELFISLFD